MSKKLSEFYGLNIYSLKEGEYVGKVEDMILNLNEGMVISLCLKPLDGGIKTPGEVKKVILEGINYEDVNGVGDIIMIKNKPKERSSVGVKGRKNGRMASVG